MGKIQLSLGVGEGFIEVDDGHTEKPKKAKPKPKPKPRVRPPILNRARGLAWEGLDLDDNQFATLQTGLSKIKGVEHWMAARGDEESTQTGFTTLHLSTRWAEDKEILRPLTALMKGYTFPPPSDNPRYLGKWVESWITVAETGDAYAQRMQRPPRCWTLPPHPAPEVIPPPPPLPKKKKKKRSLSPRWHSPKMRSPGTRGRKRSPRRKQSPSPVSEDETPQAEPTLTVNGAPSGLSPGNGV